MIKDAIEKIEGMTHAATILLDGREYTTKDIFPVLDPAPEPITSVHTLQGLVDYLEYNVDLLEMKTLMIHVESPTRVNLYSGLYGGFLTRAVYMKITAEVPAIRFGVYHGVEDFSIMLQSMFHPTKDLSNILRIIGNLKDSAVKTISDDGVSQQVTVKRGVATVAEEIIPNPAILQPFRSFPEIEQPESGFVFRMKSADDGGMPLCCLFEADGEAWRLEAIQRIAEWVRYRMEGMAVIA